MNSKKEKKTIVGLVVSIIALLMFTAGMTFAYFTASSSATSSTMTFGTLAVDINSYSVSSQNCHTPIVPGCVLDVAGTIVTTSTIDSLVRIKPSVTVTPAQNSTLVSETAASQLLGILVASFESEDNGNWLRKTENNVATGEYLYYVNKLTPNGTASLAGVKIRIPTSLGNEWQGATFTVTILVEAIQAEHVGVDLTGNAQAKVNSMATATNAVSAWAAVATESQSGGGDSGNGSNDPAPEPPELGEAITNLSFTDISNNASEEDAVEMNSLNNINASNSNLMSSIYAVSVAKNANTTGAIVIPDYVCTADNGTTWKTTSTYGELEDFYDNGTIIVDSVTYSIYKVTTISGNAFSSCTGLTSITIPNTITSLCDNAFKNCTNLESVTIPDSITSIGSNIFDGCPTTTIGNIKYVGYTDNNDFIPVCLVGVVNKSTSMNNLQIPNTVKIICAGVFAGSSGLTGSLIIPNSVTSIGTSAFIYCSGLTSVTISNSITSIDSATFLNCSGLTSITIPNSVTSIGESAFQNCTNLTSVTIPNSVTNIGVNAFNNCPTTTIGNIKYVGYSDNNVFIPVCLVGVDNKSTSMNNLQIPNTVKFIGDNAFQECSGLTGVLTIPESVISIGNYAFYDCSNLTSITIPESVTSIGKDAFYNCPTTTIGNIKYLGYMDNNDFIPVYLAGVVSTSASMNNLQIPNTVKFIGKDAFKNCTNLTSITIPESVTSIGDYAFANCSGLTSITIPSSVTSIGNGVFSCSGLTSITIPSSVTSIGDHAFTGCGSLTSVTIPESVTSIGDYAFQSCSGLTSIIIPSSVTSIGKYTFDGCSGLTSVYYGGSAGQWNSISIGSSNTLLKNATRYYYSEEQQAGNYWHFVNNVPTAW